MKKRSVAAAVDRLDALQAAVAQHLATLGKSR